MVWLIILIRAVEPMIDRPARRQMILHQISKSKFAGSHALFSAKKA
jgi:hypothetical protein